MQITTTPAAAASLAAISDSLRGLITDVIETAEGWNCYRAEVEAIETEARSGFIPYTDGGFFGRASSTLYGSDGGGYLPACLRSVVDSSYRDMVAAYAAETYPGETFTAEEAEARFNRDYAPSRSAEPWGDTAFYQTPEYARFKLADDFQQAWESEDSAFFYDARAIVYGADNIRNETGEAEVYFFAAVNVDLDYGRDCVSYAGGDMHRGAWSRTVKIADLTPAVLDECKAAMIAALAAA